MKASLTISYPGSLSIFHRLTYDEAIEAFKLSEDTNNDKLTRSWVNSIAKINNVSKKKVRKDCGIE